MLAQRRDDRRLGGRLHGFQFTVAMAEALAGRRDAHEIVEITLLAHVRQHLERKVQ
jgi:hypothetical protein